MELSFKLHRLFLRTHERLNYEVFHETSNTITGNSGCNSYQAAYQQHNSQIRFQDFASTAEGCLGPEGVQENLYMQALSQAETMLVTAKTMTITGAGGKDILQFSSSQP